MYYIDCSIVIKSNIQPYTIIDFYIEIQLKHLYKMTKNPNFKNQFLPKLGNFLAHFSSINRVGGG